MNDWLVKIILKSGKEIEVIYQGPEMHSTNVAEKIITGGPNTMHSFYDKTKTHNILVLVGEIAALDISCWRG